MGWFDEQIRQAKKNDQDVFEEAILRMASVVLGKNAGEMNDSRIVTKETIDEILKFYHYKPVEIPDMITDPDEQLEYCLRPHGIMRRKVELKKGWYKDSYGPLMAFRNEDDMPVALFPKSVSGYWYKDPESGKHVTINKKNQGEFAEDAICFYRPLPLRKLDTSDLFVFMKSCFSVSDWVLLLAMAGVFTAVGMMMPYITRLLTGFVLRSGKNAILIGTAVFILSVIISKELVNAVYGLAVTRMQSKASLSIESAVMMRLLNLPAEFFRQYTAGELASRFQAITQLCQLMIGNVLSMGLTAVFSLAYMYQVFHYASGLLLPALLIILMTVVINLMAANKQQKVTAKVMEQQAKTSGISYALICGIQKVKLAGAEKRAFARWANEYAKQTDTNYNAPLLILISSALTRAVTLIGTIVLYYFAVKTKVEPSKYISFNSAFGMITGAFASLAGVTLMIAQIRPILEMIKPILIEEPESADNKAMVNAISGSIELSNVYFRYKENMPYVVDGMSLKIMPGEYIAIVGTTGCGKSTLMRLLLGFETPERGAIYYDGKDMSKLDLKSLRRRIGAVTQDGGLFQGSIYSNITISAPQLSQNEAWEAAEIAGIADDIRNMPLGMHSMISEGQGGISGGQKQRIMIARAIAPKPRLLMFDEATSALDNITQK